MLGLLLAASLQVQSTPPDEREPGLRVDVEVQATAALDLRKIEEALTSPDLAEREAAFDEVLERAVCDEGLQRWLSQAAQSSDRVELAWSCRLVLREIECQGERVAVPTPPLMLRLAQPSISGEVLAQWMAIQKKAEQLFGPISGDLTLLLAPIPTAREPEVERVYAQAPGPETARKSEHVQVEAGPEGFRISVRRGEGEASSTEVYEGESLESLLRQHPELSRLLGLRTENGRRIGFRVKPERGFVLGPEINSVQRTDVLGVQLNVVPPGRSVELGLAPGEGLEVGLVTPGTIARALSLRKGDVILSVAGRAIRGLDDVSIALAERAKGEGVQVVWFDRHGRRQSKTWSPLDPVTARRPEAKAPTSSGENP